MKKLLLSGACAALALGAMAESLTPQQALSRVYTDGAGMGLRYAPAASARLVDTAILDGINTYYVFSGSNQTMIVSADDVAAPLLGSFDAEVTDMTAIPDNMKWWLSEYSRRIAWAVEQQEKQPNRIKVLLKQPDLRTATYQNVSPMLKTTWDQGAPYYNMCPRISGRYTYTGCVATAMAQVMNYFKWPQGAGSGSATITCNGQTYSMDFSQTTFDWANMLDSYSGSSTTTQKNAVALLMKACGYSVDMDYGTDASGAVSSDLVHALIDNFGYDKGINYDHRDFYSYDQWVDKIYAEMAAGRPVLYGGSGDSGGHQFVFDGFRASDKAFHINWGWSGAYDGYFLVDALDPEGQGIGGNGGEGFNSGQDAVIGIQKPVSGSVAAEPYIMYFNGSMLVGQIQGTTITFSIDNGTSQGGYFANMSGRTFNSVTYGTRIVNADTKEVIGTYVSSNAKNIELPTGSGFSLFIVSGIPTLANGTYDFYTVYREGDGEWKVMRCDYGYNPYVRYVYTDGTPEEVSSYADFYVIGYDGPDAGEVGKEFEYTATFFNNEKSVASMLVTAYFCQEENGQLYIAAEAGDPQMVELAAGATKDYKFSGVIDQSMSSGTYYIVFTSPDLAMLNEESCMPEVTLTGGTDVAVTSISYSKQFEQSQSFRVNVRVQNKGSKSVSLGLSGYLFDMDYNIVDLLGSSTTKNIAAGASTTFYINGTLDANAPSGNHYLVIADSNTSDILAVDQIYIYKAGAIEDVAADDATVNAEYIDLSGRKVTGDAKGIVIRRVQGQKALKVAR